MQESFAALGVSFIVLFVYILVTGWYFNGPD